MKRLSIPTILAVLLSWCQCELACAQPAAGDADTIRQQLNRKPNGGEKPFAPADGSTAKLNPPAFVWLPLAKRPAHYVLAVSRAEDFGDGVTTIVPDVPISVHVPTAAMDAGQWYWRVGVRLADGKIAWGDTRKFTIAENAQIWPLPKIDEVLAKVPQEHPRLFFPHGGLEKARAECSKSMADEYASLLRSARSCIGEELVSEPERVKREELGTGSPHDFVAIMRGTRPPMDKMEQCGLAYLLSGEERFGQEAKRRLLHFFSWDPEGSTSLFHNDEPAMWVMQRGTRAYDFTYDLFSPEERAKIEPVMKARYEQFLKRLTRMPFESRPYSSHPARDLGFLGEGAILFIHEWPEAREWLDYVMQVYWSVYPAWAGEDGGWQEGPGYWGAYMSFALHFVTSLEKVADARLIDKPFFRNTPYYKLYTNPPYAKKSPFGDGQENQASRGAGNLIYQFSTLLQDPYLRWYPEFQKTQSGTGPLGFALADPSLKAKPPADLPQARVFAGGGSGCHARQSGRSEEQCLPGDAKQPLRLDQPRPRRSKRLRHRGLWRTPGNCLGLLPLVRIAASRQLESGHQGRQLRDYRRRNRPDYPQSRGQRPNQALLHQREVRLRPGRRHARLQRTADEVPAPRDSRPPRYVCDYRRTTGPQGGHLGVVASLIAEDVV